MHYVWLGKGGNMIVKLVVSNKVHQVSEKMADAAIALSKNKYSAQNVNAIVAVRKGDMIVLQKDVYRDTEAFDKAVKDWEHGGYKCYYTKKEEVK